MDKDIIVNEMLNEEQFMKTLTNYYSIKLREEAHFVMDLGVKYTDISVIPDIKIYYEKYIMGEHIRVLVKECEIQEALINYANYHGYDLLSFNYYGNVRRVGLYDNEDTPMFQGVVLHMKKKGNVRTRRK